MNGSGKTAPAATLLKGSRWGIPIEKLDVSAYTVPTDLPEGDGTIKWNKTTLVLVEITAGNQTGLGYSYADTATATLIRDKLAGIVRGHDALGVPDRYYAMLHEIRNLGRPGVVSMAISAVDTALWDLKGKLLGLPLVSLWGQVREAVDIYGSGGFTTYTLEQLQKQLGGWADQGISRLKMKVGTNPQQDLERVQAAREAIGPGTELFVDANGAYSRKQALKFAEEFARLGVVWFEEPVSSDDLEGLRLLRDRGPAGMDIAAGEYGYDLWYFQHMLEAGAVDVLQADATRCGGFSGIMGAAKLVEARSMPLSAHCAPTLHVHVGCVLEPMRHLEYFHDHVRIENMFFEGVPQPIDGALRPNLSRPGLGLEFKRKDAEKYAVS